jgi:hypothetical protein
MPHATPAAPPISGEFRIPQLERVFKL